MKSSRFDDSNPNYPNDVWDKVDKCWVPKASIKADEAALLNGEAIAPEFSEDALALRFADLHADKLRYVAQWGKWLAWTGTHWESENTLAVFDMARKICRDAAGAAISRPRQRDSRKPRPSPPSKCSPDPIGGLLPVEPIPLAWLSLSFCKCRKKHQELQVRAFCLRDS
jgi:hypothetical protein